MVSVSAHCQYRTLGESSHRKAPALQGAARGHPREPMSAVWNEVLYIRQPPRFHSLSPDALPAAWHRFFLRRQHNQRRSSACLFFYFLYHFGLLLEADPGFVLVFPFALLLAFILYHEASAEGYHCASKAGCRAGAARTARRCAAIPIFPVWARGTELPGIPQNNRRKRMQLHQSITPSA